MDDSSLTESPVSQPTHRPLTPTASGSLRHRQLSARKSRRSTDSNHSVVSRHSHTYHAHLQHHPYHQQAPPHSSPEKEQEGREEEQDVMRTESKRKSKRRSGNPLSKLKSRLGQSKWKWLLKGNHQNAKSESSGEQQDVGRREDEMDVEQEEGREDAMVVSDDADQQQHALHLLSAAQPAFRRRTRSDERSSGRQSSPHSVEFNPFPVPIIISTDDHVGKELEAPTSPQQMKTVTVHQSHKDLFKTVRGKVRSRTSTCMKAKTNMDPSSFSTSTLLSPQELMPTLIEDAMVAGSFRDDAKMRKKSLSGFSVPLSHAKTMDVTGSYPNLLLKGRLPSLKKLNPFPHATSAPTTSAPCLPTTTDAAEACQRGFEQIPLQHFDTIEPHDGGKATLHWRMDKTRQEQPHWTIHAFGKRPSRLVADLTKLNHAATVSDSVEPTSKEHSVGLLDIWPSASNTGKKLESNGSNSSRQREKSTG